VAGGLQRRAAGPEQDRRPGLDELGGHRCDRRSRSGDRVVRRVDGGGAGVAHRAVEPSGATTRGGEQAFGDHRPQVTADRRLRDADHVGEIAERHVAAQADVLEDAAAPLCDQHRRPSARLILQDTAGPL
jgi:hypothetical protein